MKHNFGAGPAILPQEVFKKASEAVLNFEGTGLSILEISHRTPEFEGVLNEAIALVKELFSVPEGYSVLFLQGGASTIFTLAPMNLLAPNEKGAYTDTGAWANKAIKEAKKVAQVEVLASSKDKNYTFIPKDFTVPADAKYLHVTSNNTIYGTQLQEFPKVNVPLVADMSSDIFSRPVDVSQFGLIYAGAQKNMGPAGTTLVIVKDSLLGNTGRDLPSMFDFKLHADNGSLYNTPPEFAIYVSMLTLRWLKSKGGVAGIEKENIKKADLLYGEIDNNPMFKGTCAVEDRSKMNVCFVMEEKYASLEKDFLKFAQENGCVGLKGHRSVGGFRASIYNALPYESVKALVDLMKEFAKKNA